ncbi:MAG: 4Fe-4S cluster-binding domain-containing protein [Clostridia bacterium]|nr:4Fe-4S cluster-binding domain-containing protein [Clostridia bacterium]
MFGRVHSIETFGTVDGPGIRYVIFMQGCPMRCLYCHNPDTWDINSGTQMSVQELVEDISKYTRYIDGITVSGGEPLLQIDFLIELFSEVKKMGLTTCIDTSGIVYNENLDFAKKMEKLIDVCDLILLDIKHINNDKLLFVFLY